MRGSLLDPTPLRTSGAFRRLWIGSSVNVLGGQLGAFAVLLYVWQLTGDPFWVGVAALVRGGSVVVFALVGGTVADAVDRRLLVLVTSAGQLVASAATAAVVLLDLGRLWPVLVLLAVQSALGAVGAPARRTFVPRLLPREQVAAGIALTHSSFQAAMLVGPAVAGFVAGGFGVEACFVLDTLTFVAALYGVWGLPRMRPEPAPDGAATDRPGLRATWRGFRLVAGRPVLGGAFLTDLSATVLAMPIALFPAVNERLGGTPQTLGLLLSAIAVGGIGTSLLSGRLTRSPRPGRTMLVAAATWGLALIAFGLAPVLWAALAALVVAGAADTASVLARGTIVQLDTPDAYRGRVSSIDHVVGAGAPDLGNFRAGVVASVSSAGTSAVVGGVLCVLAVGVVARTVPAVRRFRVA